MQFFGLLLLGRLSPAMPLVGTAQLCPVSYFGALVRYLVCLSAPNNTATVHWLLVVLLDSGWLASLYVRGGLCAVPRVAPAVILSA